MDEQFVAVVHESNYRPENQLEDIAQEVDVGRQDAVKTAATSVVIVDTLQEIAVVVEDAVEGKHIGLFFTFRTCRKWDTTIYYYLNVYVKSPKKRGNTS